MLKENHEVTPEAVGVSLDVLTYHRGPVHVVLPIDQDGDHDLQQRHTGKKGRLSTSEALEKDYCEKGLKNYTPLLQATVLLGLILRTNIRYCLDS